MQLFTCRVLSSSYSQKVGHVHALNFTTKEVNAHTELHGVYTFKNLDNHDIPKNKLMPYFLAGINNVHAMSVNFG